VQSVIILVTLALKQHLAQLVCPLSSGHLILAQLSVSATLAISITTIQGNVLLVHLLIQNARHALLILPPLLQPS